MRQESMLLRARRFMRYAIAALVICLSLILVACSTPPKQPTHTNVLPSVRQPAIPGANPDETRQASPIALPTARAPWAMSLLQNAGGEFPPELINSLSKYDAAILAPDGLRAGIEALAREIPERMRIVQVSGDTRLKGDKAVYPGHWLLYNGTRTTSDLPAIGGIAIVGVDDPSAFFTDDPHQGPDDLLMYALRADGTPDFTHYEEVTLVSVNRDQKWVSIRRGQHGTRPREFLSGKTILAAHVTRGPEDTSSWVVNISANSPVAPDGMRGAERMARLILEEYRQYSHLANGILVDHSRWGIHQQGGKRGPDTDNDLKPDWGYTEHGAGRLSLWAMGSVDLIRHLREGGTGFEGLGSGEGIWLTHGQSPAFRASTYTNGVVFNGFDQEAKRSFSAAFQRLQFLQASSPFIPRLSGVVVTTPTASYSRSVRGGKELSNAPYRLGLGAALLVDAGFGYASAEPGNAASLGWGKDYFLDEYTGGQGGRAHYLGKALGPPIRLHGSLGRDDLTGGSLKRAGGYVARDASTAVFDSLETRQTAGASVKIVSKGSGSVVSEQTLDTKHRGAYTVLFWARAETAYEQIDSRYAVMPLAMEVGLGEEAKAAGTVLLGKNWSQYSITLYTDNPADRQALVFRPRDAGSYWLEGVETREGTADVLYRLFEGGIVIVNGSPRTVTIDMEMIAPGMRFKAIEGNQDPEVNHGGPVAGQIVIPPRDARILVR